MTTLQEQDQRLADKVVRTHYNLSADDYINENWADEIDLVKLAIMFERKRQSERVWKLTNAFAVYAKHQGICSILEGVDCRCGLDDFMKQFESEGIKND
jgi:hypothetical protein